MVRTIISSFITGLICLVAIAACSETQDQNQPESASEAKGESAAPAEDNPLKTAYFGETHMHTAYSLDAYIGGNRLTPEDAIRFAKGETISTESHQMRIKTPLDFCAVTDHAEYVGEMYTVLTPGAEGYDGDLPTQLRNVDNYADAAKLFVKLVVENNRSDKPTHLEFWQGNATIKSFWGDLVALVDKYNDPGEFTTIQAFEWSGAPNGANLHRNILFRDNKVPEMPMSYIEINREEDLWTWLDKISDEGCTPLAIPHNSNASKGLMFNEYDSKGNPINAEYAVKRMQYERLVEVMQIKGASEVHLNFWSNDEFADFENCPSMANYSGRSFQKKNFVRNALIKGLEYQESFGENPYKMGMAGGTDNHNGLPSNTAEDNYLIGSHGYADNTAEVRTQNEIDGWAKAYDVSPGAITGVWAESNTRGAIWDAMYRRETFATSGNRIQVRLFGGSGFSDKHDNLDEFATDGYEHGVPMGGDLKLLSGESPSFLVWALKDPKEANLDRIQIIKGWYENGELQERIYNVAVSDNRVIADDGSVEALDADVNLSDGSYDSTKGSSELTALWEDPDFDPNLNAFYYARVLQIPTARWTLWDEIRTGVKYPQGVPRTVVERAWSSPIWYTPE